MGDIQHIREFLSEKRNIAITTHQKPDADAMGSSLGLKLYLESKGHTVTVITPTDYASFLFWMQGSSEVIMYEKERHDEITKIFASVDGIFCLDFNALNRINDLEDMVRQSKAIKILVDHHQQPEGFEDFTYWSEKRAATAELIYELICELGDRAQLTKAIAECLYAGIMTDTGSFRFPSTTKRVHEIIGDLIEIGADNAKVHRLIYDASSEDKLRFTGFAISQKLVVKKEFNTAYITISADDLIQYNVQTGDTEGLVNYALSMDGIVFAALITDRTGIVKMSFRSIGDFNVNQFARDHFNGGGHHNAAGGANYDTLEETVRKFESLLPFYKSELEQISENEKALCKS